MSGLSPAISKRIQGLRVVELVYSKRLRRLIVVMHSTASFARDITPVVVIAGGLFWTKVSGRLSAVDAFTTLSVVALISEPVAMLLLAWPMSSLTIVVGPVGCGKSTLLKAILGEAKVTTGVVRIHTDRIAYCGQTPWLQNVCLRDNILGSSDFDPGWYETTIRACMLENDMRLFQDGDQTLVGSGGIQLSGGQRQRVALARAVYSRRPILVLDDVFSALDRKTARAILANLMEDDGVLRKSRTTVILATHSIEHLHRADKVFALDTNGGVREQSLSEVKSEAKLARITVEDDDTEDLEGSANDQQASASPSPPSVVSSDDAYERQRGDFSLYAFYLRSIGIVLVALWLCTVVVSAVANRIPQIFVRIWLDRAPENNKFFAGYAVLSATAFMWDGGMIGLYLLKLVPTSAENLHWLLLDTVMKAKLSFLTSTDAGLLLNRFSQDMTLVSQILPLSFMFFAQPDIGIIASGAAYTVAVMPFIAAALYFLQMYYLRTSRQMRHLDLEAKSPLYTQFTETAAGLQHIRAFGWQDDAMQRGLASLDHSQKPYYYMFCIQRWLMLVLDMLVMAIAVVLVTFALNFTHTSSQSAIGLALLNVITFGENLATLLDSWISLETSLGAIARLRSFTNETPVETDPAPVLDAALLKNWPDRGRIDFQDVTAKYDVTDETARQVLDLSVTIEPGQKVGIVGRTGSGKSSMILTLLHLLDHTGSVLIDGVDISQVSRQHLRSRITTLPQDPIQLRGSVRENLCPEGQSSARAGTADDASMISALARVGLWENVSAQGGLDVDLDDIGLSHGQKQLLCLARAILHHAAMGSKVVLVDEATSNMGHETDAKMQAVMAEAFAGCTMLVVAHRLESIEDADVVLSLENGRLVKVTTREWTV
ncbi:hypothetical protein PLICBS_003684 [Purpureocillium lilacinum]|uniref:uncharacterized protein n=1 Tax=Purpureocillium lilacinum TaxID=33203 RepID=UPI002086FD83|nr:hypothetical protein PLICBS_003684 [Purpureocillium lilacinum]